MSRDVALLALCVSLSVAAASQGAVLNGLRRIKEMAQLSVLSSVLATVFGISTLLIWGREGVAYFVLAGPVATFVLGHFYVVKLMPGRFVHRPVSKLVSESRSLLSFGAAFMLTGLVWNLGHLAVRSQVQKQLGPADLGYFQAAWTISMTYIGFVLQAMGTDYYPRLAASVEDRIQANNMVNEQTEVALILAAPAILAVLGAAPMMMRLLYSQEFVIGAPILQLQVLGDILRVAAWPLGYVILAAGRARLYLVVESVAVLTLVTTVWLLAPQMGLKATGMAFLVMYLVYLPCLYVVVHRYFGVGWTRANALRLAVLLVAGCIVHVAAFVGEVLGILVGVGSALIFAISGISHLAHVANLPGPLGRVAALYQRIVGRFNA